MSMALACWRNHWTQLDGPPKWSHLYFWFQGSAKCELLFDFKMVFMPEGERATFSVFYGFYFYFSFGFSFLFDFNSCFDFGFSWPHSGLHLIASLCQRWGAGYHKPTKTLWLSLALWVMAAKKASYFIVHCPRIIIGPCRVFWVKYWVGSNKSGRHSKLQIPQVWLCFRCNSLRSSD